MNRRIKPWRACLAKGVVVAARGKGDLSLWRYVVRAESSLGCERGLEVADSNLRLARKGFKNV